MSKHIETLEPFDSGDDLVTLTTRPTEFEAHTLVAVLNDAGIDAFAFGTVQSSLPLSDRMIPVPVQVRKRDLDRAREAIKQNVADSVDLDWDEVDVGERLDNLPLKQGHGMPWPARVGYVLALIVVAIMAFGLLWPMIHRLMR